MVEHHRVRKAVKLPLLAACMVVMPVVNADTSLEELLLEKGILTKDELRILKEEESRKDEQVEQEIEKRVNAKVAEKLKTKADDSDSGLGLKAEYTKKGFTLESNDGNWLTNLQWRAQMRYSYPFGGDPRQIDDFEDDPGQSTFELRRVRMKIGGHGYQPWLKYYFEVDLQPTRDFADESESASSRVIDWRLMLEKYDFASLQLGQWKIDYNRERVDSSGKQQFVERSIVNRIFTIDRQVGMMLRGHLFQGTPADMRYYVGAFNGEGRGVRNDDSRLMYMGRLQWNFLGRDLKWSQSDTDFTEEPTGQLAFGAAINNGRCTRWSSSGCGSLDGFISPSDAENGQFRTTQWVQETAFKYRGFSWQQEFHWKNIEDRVNNSTTTLTGLYAQSGYFFHNLFPVVPAPLETAFRYAIVNEPNEDDFSVDNRRQEYTAALNWFIDGHRNKVTFDLSHLTLEDMAQNKEASDQRARVQWDVSF